MVFRQEEFARCLDPVPSVEAMELVSVREHQLSVTVRLLTQQVCVRNARSLHRSIEVRTLDDCTYMIPRWQPTAGILPEAFYQMPYMFQI
jgi:hypothetical protein